MKATGIVRKVDGLGRMVIPKEIRRTYGMKKKTDIEIYVDGDEIILQIYKPKCVFCKSDEITVEFKGKTVCGECLTKIKGEVDGR